MHLTKYVVIAGVAVAFLAALRWSHLRDQTTDSKPTSAADQEGETGPPTGLNERPAVLGRDVSELPTSGPPLQSQINSAVTVRREPQRDDEGDVTYRFRTEWVQAYDTFRAAAALSPAKERALLRILADMQENFASQERAFDELRSEAVRSPTPENTQRLNDFLDSMLDSSITAEGERRIEALLSREEWRTYSRILLPVDYQLFYGRPLSTGQETEEARVEDMSPHQLGMMWVAAFDEFRSAVGELEPARELAITRIFADAQVKLAEDAESDSEIIEECEGRLQSLFTSREWVAYREHLSSPDMYWALKIGQPIIVGALSDGPPSGS